MLDCSSHSVGTILVPKSSYTITQLASSLCMKMQFLPKSTGDYMLLILWGAAHCWLTIVEHIITDLMTPEACVLIQPFMIYSPNTDMGKWCIYSLCGAFPTPNACFSMDFWAFPSYMSLCRAHSLFSQLGFCQYFVNNSRTNAAINIGPFPP